MDPIGDMPLLSCRNVSKNYGSLIAVGDLSFDLERGEILGIGGPNGAGKTTLFEMISGQSSVSSGQIILEGKDITRVPPVGRCHAGMARVFQLNTAFDSLSVRENVLLAGYYGRANRFIPGLRMPREAEERADAVLEQVGLIRERYLPASALPVFGRKLLMIATALVMDPKLLLLDEPVGGLTEREIDQVAELIARVTANGLTVVLIEHVMRFLVQLSSRVMILHHGRKLYEGDAAGLVHDRDVVEVYLGKAASQDISGMSAGGAHAN